MKRPLIIGGGLVGGALVARLPGAVALTRQRGFELADEATWPDVAGYDVAFFCAAMARMNVCEDDPAGTAHINVTQTIKLLEKLVQQGIHPIFLSTDKVFDGAKPHIEASAPVNPQNEYGRQKAQVEAWCKAQSRATVLRLSKVIGPVMPLFDQWQAQWAKGEVAEAFGDMTLAPVWIEDVVDAMIEIGARGRFGIEQISGAEDMTYADMARKLAPNPALVKAISYREKGIPENFVPHYTSYAATIGPVRSVGEVLSLWRASQKSAITAA